MFLLMMTHKGQPITITDRYIADLLLIECYEQDDETGLTDDVSRLVFATYRDIYVDGTVEEVTKTIGEFIQ